MTGRKYKKLGFAAIVLAGAGVWLTARSTPWARARRALEKGDPDRAVEVLVEALGAKTWPPEKDEAMRDLLIKGYIGKGAIEPAEEELKILREKYPTNTTAPLGLGIINLARDRGAFAVDYFNEAIKLDPNDIRPYLRLSRYYSGCREYKKAESALAAGLIRFPGDERLLRIQGDLFFNQGMYLNALNQYEPLLKSAPKNRGLKFQIATAFLYSGELERASEIYSSLRPASGTDEAIELALSKILFMRGKHKESAAIHERLYREDNRRVTAGVAWAKFLATDGRPAEAEKILASMENILLPLGGDISSFKSAETFYDLDRLQSIREAARDQHVNLTLAKANMAELSHRYSDAEQFLIQAMSLDNGNFMILYEFAELARLKNEPEERLKWADRAVVLYHDHPTAHLLKAGALLALRRTPDAIDEARTVSAAYPRLSSAQALLSRALLIENRPKEALQVAEKSVQMNYGDASAQLALALALSSVGKKGEADSAFRYALEIDPSYAEARAEWGRQLKAQGMVKEANIQLQEAHRLEPVVYKQPR